MSEANVGECYDCGQIKPLHTAFNSLHKVCSDCNSKRFDIRRSIEISRRIADQKRDK